MLQYNNFRAEIFFEIPIYYILPAYFLYVFLIPLNIFTNFHETNIWKCLDALFCELPIWKTFFQVVPR